MLSWAKENCKKRVSKIGERFDEPDPPLPVNTYRPAFKAPPAGLSPPAGILPNPKAKAATQKVSLEGRNAAVEKEPIKMEVKTEDHGVTPEVSSSFVKEEIPENPSEYDDTQGDYPPAAEGDAACPPN